MDINETIYKRMGFSGIVSIILGVLLLVLGIAGGVMLLISGGKLISGRSRIMI